MQNKTSNIDIHTFMLSAKIKSKLYYEIESEFVKYAKAHKCRLFKQSNASLTWQTRTLCLRQKGLNIALVKTQDSDELGQPKRFENYYIRYFVNPSQLFGDDHFNVYTERNFTEVCDKIDETVQSVCRLLPPVYHMNLRRIAFCVNIPLKDPNIVELYIKLLRKYDSYKGFKVIGSDGNDSVDYPYQTSTILKSGAVTLYIYEKTSDDDEALQSRIIELSLN